jgi:hypothetical protein
MQNLLDPAILFFVFGVFAGAVRSNLQIPEAVAKFLSLYLLMALGLKGGFALAQSGVNLAVGVSLFAAVLMALLVPLLGYALLRHRVNRFDAAAVAASYGSVSAVTFLTAMQYLENAGTEVGGHMAVAMVLMESPAIIVAVLLANTLRQHSVLSAHRQSSPSLADPDSNTTPQAGVSVLHIIHESLTNGAHLLLLGAMVVGFVTGDAGRASMQPFSGDLFKGMLSFFLLDMGLMVARNFSDARKATPSLIAYALLAPPVHALLALTLGWSLSMSAPDTALLMVLSASASYIVVPAVLRYAIPEANPAIYFGLSLGITFPFNILVGIPLYTSIARLALG